MLLEAKGFWPHLVLHGSVSSCCIEAPQSLDVVVQDNLVSMVSYHASTVDCKEIWRGRGRGGGGRCESFSREYIPPPPKGSHVSRPHFGGVAWG